MQRQDLRLKLEAALKKKTCKDKLKVRQSQLEKDDLGTALLPEDTRDRYFAVKVPGDGNCLYNCISIFLSGKWKKLNLKKKYVT